MKGSLLPHLAATVLLHIVAVIGLVYGSERRSYRAVSTYVPPPPVSSAPYQPSPQSQTVSTTSPAPAKPLEPEKPIENAVATPAESAPGISKLDQLIESVSQRDVSTADLAGLNKNELRILRNGIYAKRGRDFKDPALKGHFEKYSWYHPDTIDDSVISSRLSPSDRKNLDVIRAAEAVSSDESWWLDQYVSVETPDGWKSERTNKPGAQSWEIISSSGDLLVRVDVTRAPGGSKVKGSLDATYKFFDKQFSENDKRHYRTESTAFENFQGRSAFRWTFVRDNKRGILQRREVYYMTIRDGSVAITVAAPVARWASENPQLQHLRQTLQVVGPVNP